MPLTSFSNDVTGNQYFRNLLFCFFKSTKSWKIKVDVRMFVHAFVLAKEAFEKHTRLSSDTFGVIQMASLKTSFDVARALLSAGGPLLHELNILRMCMIE